MDEKELDQKIEAFAKSSDQAREQMEFLTKAVASMGLQGVEAKKKILEMSNGIQQFNISMKKSAAEISKSIKDLKDSFDKGELIGEELSEQLKVLRDQINRTSDQGKKQDLMNAKADLEARNARNQANAALKDSVFNMAGALTAGAARAFSGVARAALQGGDSFAVAGEMMNAGVDLINTANQGGANALKTFGGAAMLAGGKVGRFGLAASIAGESLSLLSNTVSDLAKSGIGFMIAQTRELLTGFQQMSAAGAIYTGGMRGMTSTALAAGMTLGQFSKAVSANSTNLSKTGLGVANASKRMASAMQEGGVKARQGMFALGMTLEEQADAYATTMSIMAGPSGQLKASNAEVAAQTQEYAKNLKIISGITGQDAKARMEKVRQDNDTLAFNAVLNKMSEEERLATEAAMAAMSDTDARAFREKKLYGEVISKDLAITRATNSGIRKAQDETFEASQRGALNVRKIEEIYKRNAAEALKESTARGSDLGIAKSPEAVATAAAMNEATQFMIKSTKAANVATTVDKTFDEAAAGGGGKEVQLMEQQQNFAIEMQKIAYDHLDTFATALKLTSDAALKAVKALSALATAAEKNPMAALLASLSPLIIGIVGTAVIAALAGKGGRALFKGTGGPKGPDRYPKGTVIDGKKVGGQFKPADASPKSSAVKTGLKKIPVIGTAIGLGLAASEVKAAQDDKTLTKEQKREETSAIVGREAAGIAGAAAGAAMGSVIPGIGTVIGGIIGGAVGYMALAPVGEKIGRDLAKDDKFFKKAKQTPVVYPNAEQAPKAPVTKSVDLFADTKKLLAPTAEQIARRENKLVATTKAAEREKELYGAVVSKDLAKPATTKKAVAGGPTSTKKAVAGGPTTTNKSTTPTSMTEKVPQLTAPKPMAKAINPQLAVEQSKLHNMIAAKDEVMKKITEKPPSNASPAEQQQISLLQSILSAMQQNNRYASGLLQNSY